MIKEEDIRELFRQHQGGRFDIRRILGIGGMGVVVQAFDTKLKVSRAIKIFNPELLRHESLIRRFENEATIMAGIDHPNIVRVFDIGEIGQYHFIIMEWIDGGSLSSIVKHSGAMHSRLALEMIYRVCEALAVAHKRGIIHRDIKPDNILVTTEGVPKVTDFGIAHMDDDQKDRVTSTNETMGTEGYASPQQLSNFALTDARDDIYSVAVTFWALMTGLRPPSILFFHDIESSPELLEHIPVCLHAILKKAVAYNSSERYQSMDEFIRALRTVEERLPPMTGRAIVSIPVDQDADLIDQTEISATKSSKPSSTKGFVDVVIEPTKLGHHTPASLRNGRTLAYHSNGAAETAAQPVAEEPETPKDVAVPAQLTGKKTSRRPILIVSFILFALGIVSVGLVLTIKPRTKTEPVRVNADVVVASEDVVTITPDILVSTDTAPVIALVPSITPVVNEDIVSHEGDAQDTAPSQITLPSRPSKDRKPMKPVVLVGKEHETPHKQNVPVTNVEPAPPKPEAAVVRVGLELPPDDTARVWLVGTGGKHKLPCSVAPGVYKVVAAFKDRDGEMTVMTNVEIKEGMPLRLSCDSVFAKCRKL